MSITAIQVVPTKLASADRALPAYQPVSVSGGTPPYVWSITPALPQGLSFDTATGYVGGQLVNFTKPLSTATTYTLQVHDSLSQNASSEFTIKCVSRLDMPISEFYNYIYNSLFGLMGTTATGYGATLSSSPVATHEPVQALAWNQLQNDIIRCQIHQNGTSSNVLTVVGTGTIVNSNVANRAWTQLQFLEINPGRVASNQLETTMTNTGHNSSSTWVSTWTNTVALGYQTQVSYSWTNPNQTAYFFNLGGSIKPEISSTSTNSATWQAWQYLIDQANQNSFGLTEYTLAQANAGIYQHTIPSSITPGPDAKAIVAYYNITGSVLTATLTFLAGYTAISGSNTSTSVQLTVSNDFVTSYSSGANGGIQAPTPQSLL